MNQTQTTSTGPMQWETMQGTAEAGRTQRKQFFSALVSALCLVVGPRIVVALCLCVFPGSAVYSVPALLHRSGSSLLTADEAALDYIATRIAPRFLTRMKADTFSASTGEKVAKPDEVSNYFQRKDAKQQRRKGRHEFHERWQSAKTAKPN